MTEILAVVFRVATSAILLYFLLINFFYILFMVLSFTGIFHYRNKVKYLSFKDIFYLPLVKPISIIAPVHNEELSIVESVNSLLSLEYPLYEVIVVNDGSTDGTLQKLQEAFDLQRTKWVFRKSIDTKPVKGIYKSLSHSKLIVLDKVNGKKADALNAGLNISHYPLFCAIDGDSVLEKDSLQKMVRPFLENPEETIATGGILRLSNGCTFEDGQIKKIGMPRNSIARLQVLEYLRAFLGGRMGLNKLKSLLIISGAFGLFRKDVTLQCGGYRTDTIGEDMDLIVRIKKYLKEKKRSFRICFIPDPICWTEAPESFSSLMNQRNRWHRGLIETLFHNRRMIFNPAYGPTGIFAMPFYLIFELLGPIIELIGYVTFIVLIFTGNLNHPFAILFFLVAVFMGCFISLMAVLLEEYSLRRYPKLSDLFIISLYSLLENFIYRQSLALIRSKAFLDFLRGKQEWGEMKKIGFAKEAEQP
jgi:cellulose synthase/poly-beta-1,6-N-acetylglucosamine synthase-like glycosyltransferase